MDWKPYYRRELDSPSGRWAVDTLLDGASDDGLARAVARGTVVSFPHTALSFAGPLQARVVSALYRSGVERVIALGVLHGATSAPTRIALDEEQPAEVRRAALAGVIGGTMPAARAIKTPYGDLLLATAAEDGSVPVRIDRSGLLADEFSLDTFFALMRRAADLRGVAPLPVLPVFVGPTRDPLDGSFGVAERLAAWLRASVGAHGATALVATGDVVHYGTAYGAPDADPREPAERLATRFRAEVDRVLATALAARDWDLAHRLSAEVLRNDQREILAVVSGFLGPARHRIVHFELSDYAGILGRPSPCVVASALLVYEWSASTTRGD